MSGFSVHAGTMLMNKVWFASLSVEVQRDAAPLSVDARILQKSHKYGQSLAQFIYDTLNATQNAHQRLPNFRQTVDVISSLSSCWILNMLYIAGQVYLMRSFGSFEHREV